MAVFVQVQICPQDIIIFLRMVEMMDLRSQVVEARSSSSQVLHTVVTRELRNPAQVLYIVQ